MLRIRLHLDLIRRARSRITAHKFIYGFMMDHSTMRLPRDPLRDRPDANGSTPPAPTDSPSYMGPKAGIEE